MKSKEGACITLKKSGWTDDEINAIGLTIEDIDRERRNALIFKMYREDGFSGHQIAEKLGLSHQGVYDILGGETKNRVKERDRINIDYLREQLKLGSSIAEISKDIGISEYHIKIKIKEMHDIKDILKEGRRSKINKRCLIRKQYWEQHNPLGQLTLVDIISQESQGTPRYYAKCICRCGKKLTVDMNNLRSGMSLSCGSSGCIRSSSPEEIRRVKNLAKYEPKFNSGKV